MSLPFQDFLKDKSADERKAFFVGLLAVVCADGRLDPKEEPLLLRWGRRCGLTQHEMEQCLKEFLDKGDKGNGTT